MFSQVVDLYRALGRPPIEGGSFYYEGEIASETSKLISDMATMQKHFGSFSSNTKNGTVVTIEFSLPGSEYGRFHDSINSFIESSPSLEAGTPPDEFYICDLDYYSKDTSCPPRVKNLFQCCEFIILLSKLASDAYAAEYSPRSNRIVFILAADGKAPARTFSMRTKVDNAILDLDIPHLNFLRALLSDRRENQIHIEERRIILQSAIAETLILAGDSDNMFTYLVRHWGDVLLRYRHNFQAFLHQYSFEKVRKDIAAAEIDHATKLSGVLGDVAGKLLALPVSLGGLILLRNAKNIDEFIVVAVGLVVVSCIFAGILVNQWLQIDRLRSSFNIIFSQFDSTYDSLPRNLREPIGTAKQKIKTQGRFLVGTFVFFTALALLPAAGAIYIAVDRFNNQPDATAQLAKQPEPSASPKVQSPSAPKK